MAEARMYADHIFVHPHFRPPAGSGDHHQSTISADAVRMCTNVCDENKSGCSRLVIIDLVVFRFFALQSRLIFAKCRRLKWQDVRQELLQFAY